MMVGVSMAIDTVGLLNFLLNIAIIALGYAGYQKTKGKLYLYIALAFIVFAVTNLLAALGMADQLLYPIIVMRFVGYVTVLYALYAGMGRK